MRKLTGYDNLRQANDLLDALVARGIEATLRGTGVEAEVWVIDHDQMARASEALAEYTAHGRVMGAGETAAKIRQDRALEQAGRDKNFVDVRSTWGAAEPPGIGPVTVFLVLASVLVGIYSGMGDPLTITIRNLAIEPNYSATFLASVREGEVWRLITPIFIHYGVFHLLFNMSGVWRFARQVEHQQGPLVLLALVLWTAIPGNLLQYAVSGPRFGGMSGVLYGVFGYVWMQARFNRRYAYAIDEQSTWLMMIWFVLCLTGLVGPIANVAHAGGLIAGLIAGLPAYVMYLRARAANPEFKPHSWADVHVRGKSRVYRQFVAPYVPLWLLVIAAVAIAVE